jgi:hypothetical protein
VSRATTHEYVCLGCGLSMKARELEGQVKATNAPTSGQVRLCLCTRCQEEAES